MLKEAEHSASTEPAAPVELVPRPRGTPGRKGFQLQSKMGISKHLYKEIRVCFLLPYFTHFVWTHSIAGFCEDFDREVRFGPYGCIQAPTWRRSTQDTHGGMAYTTFLFFL